jgi:hypothetical protein
MPLYEQRHYEDMARHISTLRAHVPQEHWVKICLADVARFQRDNPKFKPVKYLQACGLTEGQALLLKG